MPFSKEDSSNRQFPLSVEKRVQESEIRFWAIQRLAIPSGALAEMRPDLTRASTIGVGERFLLLPWFVGLGDYQEWFAAYTSGVIELLQQTLEDSDEYGFGSKLNQGITAFMSETLPHLDRQSINNMSDRWRQKMRQLLADQLKQHDYHQGIEQYRALCQAMRKALVDDYRQMMASADSDDDSSYQSLRVEEWAELREQIWPLLMECFIFRLEVTPVADNVKKYLREYLGINTHLATIVPEPGWYLETSQADRFSQSVELSFQQTKLFYMLRGESDKVGRWQLHLCSLLD